ncbi:hypothetical protein ABBQ32_000440 [Trebouxia sp. C0010 RCD-2024]
MLRPQFVLFGDSLTQKATDPQGGWAAALAHNYQRKVDVVNRGYSGYNSRWAKHLLEKIFPAKQPRVNLVTLFWGANDAALPDRHSARQHVPVQEFKANLASMVSHLHAADIQSIVLMTPPPVCETGRIKHNSQTSGQPITKDSVAERNNEYTQRYAAAVVQLGQELKLPAVDLWSSMQAQPDWQSSFLCDGLHLTSAGNSFVYDQLQSAIDQAYPYLSTNKMPFDFPDHTEVNAEDPAASFIGTCQAKMTN